MVILLDFKNVDFSVRHIGDLNSDCHFPNTSWYLAEKLLSSAGPPNNNVTCTRNAKEL